MLSLPPLPKSIQRFETENCVVVKKTWSVINPVPRIYVRGFGKLPFGKIQNIHLVPTVLDRGRIVFSRRS